LPACATFPEDRLLFFAGLGAMPLIASLVATCFGPEREHAPPAALPKPTFALAGFWLVLHGAVAPMLLPYRSLTMYRYERALREAGSSLFSQLPPNVNRAIVVVNSENFYFAGMMGMTRAARAEPTTARMLTLAGTLEDITLTRLDDRRIEVRPKLGFLSRVFNQLYMRERLTRGTQMDLEGVSVTVSEIDQFGHPTAALFEFAKPLEDPGYLWVSWQHGRYAPFPIPAAGTSVVIRS
jgi:hypothetical protein